MALTQTYQNLAVRPRHSKSHTPNEWLDLKPRIAFLYCEQDMKLEDVMKLIKEEFHFEATKKMYKSRFTAWGLRKYNRLTEAQAVIRTRNTLAANGLSAVFFIRGELADMNDLERCCKRAKTQTDISEVDAEKELPEGVQCVTFKDRIVAIDDPDTFNHLRSFLHHTAVHIDACFDQGIWWSESDDAALETCSRSDSELSLGCLEHVSNASFWFRTGHSQLGGAYARRGFAHFSELVEVGSLNILSLLLSTLQKIQHNGQNEFKDAILTNLANLTPVVLPLSHPGQELFTAFKSLANENLAILSELHITQRRHLIAQKLGENHFEVVYIDFLVWRPLSKPLGTLTEVWYEIKAAYEVYGKQSLRAFIILRYYCLKFFGYSRWNEAQELFEVLCIRAEESFPGHTVMKSFYCLGIVQWCLKRYADARVSWLKGLDICRNCEGPIFDNWGRDLFEKVILVCDKLKLFDEVTKYKSELEESCRKVLEEDEMDQQRINSIIPGWVD